MNNSSIIKTTCAVSWCTWSNLPSSLPFSHMGRRSLVTRLGKATFCPLSHCKSMHMNRLSFMLKWWAESVTFMSAVYARPLPEVIWVNPPCIILYGQRAACRWWLVRSCCDKQEVRCYMFLNLSHLWYGCQRCTLAVPQHCTASARGCSIFGKYLNML